MQHIFILLTSPSNIIGTAIPTETPPLSLTLGLLGLCCIMLLLVGIVVLGFFVRAGNRKPDEQKKDDN
jgi:hypothetical protein